MLRLLLVLLVVCHHPGLSFSRLASKKIHFPYYSPLTTTVYQVAQGSVSGIQKAIDDHNHDTIAKGEEFTVLVDYSLPFYNKERKWYEIPARFCYGKDIEGWLNQKRLFSHPYLVRPSSVQIPVPFVVPFSKIHNVTLPDGSIVFVSGTVHEQFKTFEVNGAKYDASSGILMSFSAVSPEKAGKISGIDILRERRRVRRSKSDIAEECSNVEWSNDTCVPGLDYIMNGYDVKSLKFTHRWLKLNFSGKKDNRYEEDLTIPEMIKATYLVPKDMSLREEASMTESFSYVFASVEEQVNESLNSVGLQVGSEVFMGSGLYKSYSKRYKNQANSGAMFGTDIKLFSARMSFYYLKDKANWDDDFKKRWKNMLEGRKKKDAMDFFTEYGTHYVFSAVMGGRQETIFTVDYCKVNEDEKTKLDFMAKLKEPYMSNSAISGNVKAYYNNKKKAMSNMIISGPKTTCTGGNSRVSSVCYDLERWQKTLLENPYPIKMKVKPFYNLVKGGEDRRWMEKMFQEYLKADGDEVEIKKEIKMKVKCDRGCFLSSTLPVIVIAGIVIFELW